jgi:hypothetical protein
LAKVNPALSAVGIHDFRTVGNFIAVVAAISDLHSRISGAAAWRKTDGF